MGDRNDFDERGLEAKLEALRHEPSQLEKTMTEAQLYKIGSPSWAKNLTATQARAVIVADENFLEYDDIEKYLFKHVHHVDLLHQDLLAMVRADIPSKKKKKG